MASISSNEITENFQILHIPNNLARRNLLTEYFEKLFAFLLLVILSPIILFVLFLVSIDLRENPIFIQKRGLTLEKGIFYIYKIRTMKGKEHRHIQSSGGKVEMKNYVTPFGRILRKSGFDEILQLINVVKGEMKLIGPRPLSIYDLSMMAIESPNLYNRRDKIKSKPGITGYWQIYGNRDKGTINLIYCDEYYDLNNSISLNIKIILKTFFKIITLQHSDSVMKNVSVNQESYLDSK